MKIEIRYQNFDNTADDYGRYFLWNTDADERETVKTFATEQDAADYRDEHEEYEEYEEYDEHEVGLDQE